MKHFSEIRNIFGALLRDCATVLILAVFLTPAGAEVPSHLFHAEDRSVQKLDTSWMLFEDTLLSPGQISNRTGRPFTLPGSIKDHLYGAHTLVIHVKSLTPGTRYGLHMPEPFSAYTLFIDDSLYTTCGTVGKSRTAMRAQWKTKDIFFTPERSDITITLWLSNYVYNWTGFMTAPTIGKSADIISATQKHAAFDMLLFGAVFIIGIYHLFLYFNRRIERSSLAFAVLALAFSARILVSGELFIMVLNPTLPWELLIKANIAGIAVIMLSLGWYIKTVMGSEPAPRIFTGVLVLSALYGIFVLFTPPWLFSRFLTPYHFVILLSCGLYLFMLIRSALRGNRNMYFPIVGIGILCVTALNDILVVHNAVAGIQLSPVGMLVFVMIQAWLIAKRVAEAFDKSAAYQHQLEELNESLEQKTAERTRELEETVRQLQAAFDEVKELTGLLPICAACKSIKDDGGYWHRLEAYMSRHTSVEFSHSLCPECAVQLYPDLDLGLEKKIKP